MTNYNRELIPSAGDPVDIAPFGQIRWWSGSGPQSLGVHDIHPEPDGAYRAAVDPETGDWHLGLEWPDPQNVHRVSVQYVDEILPNAELRVEYWRKYWPSVAPERRPGAHSAWIGVDDPWNGSWTTVRAERAISGDTCVFTFDPMDIAELRNVTQLAEAADYLVPFRRTLKIRLVWQRRSAPIVRESHVFDDGVWQDVQASGVAGRPGGTVDEAADSDELATFQEDAPLLRRVAVYSEGTWDESKIQVQFHEPGDWSGYAEVHHGHLVEVTAESLGDPVAGQSTGWQIQEPTGTVTLRVIFARGEPVPGDTVVTIWTATRSFSFFVRELDDGPIFIRDYDVFITTTGSGDSYESYLETVATSPLPIYDRVETEPEQSLNRALADMPPMDVTKQDSLLEGLGQYVVLGVDGGRQEFGLRFNGDVFLSKPFLKLTGRDATRLMWPGPNMFFRVGTGDPPDFRDGANDTDQSREDGCLPVFVSQWRDRELLWSETAFATLLSGPMTPHESRRGDEDVVAMVRFTVENPTPGAKRAQLWLVVDPQEHWELRDGLVLAAGRLVPDVATTMQWRIDPYRAEYLRCAVAASKGHLSALPYTHGSASAALPTALLYSVDLDQFETATVDLAFPFVSMDAEDEWAKVSGLDWDAEHADVVQFWRGFIEDGGQIDVPDELLSDFAKAVRTHVAITADKDPVVGLTVVAPATFSYGSCGNENCWQIAMLDEAGYHDRAEHYFETFLQTQGVAALEGLFSSAEGALQGLDFDAGKPVWNAYVFGYNLDHGCAMDYLARHYRLSGDKEWLRRVAPQLVAACDLITRERAATKVMDPAGKPARQWGLLPAGRLEDNPEWKYWFAVNAEAYGGMKACADVLADIGHPEVPRLQRDAEAYREDIRNAARRAMIETPVARLLDGTHSPRIPTRTELRGREWGWFRETAYGAIRLLDGGVFDPWEEEMTWVLKDLEDNLFVSREWGRPVDLKRYWFSHGGVTLQVNLMNVGIAYLRRGQIKHALRSLFNNFASQLFPDIRVFTEHAITELGIGIGPFYKSSDEAKAVQWLRAFLLCEEGETLHVARGAPRAWLAPGQSFGMRRMASFFGPVTYRIESDSDSAHAHLRLEENRPPQEVLIHLRRPRGQELASVIVNGKEHTDYDAASETVRIAPVPESIELIATYMPKEGCKP